MGDGMSKVTDQLYQGSARDAENARKLEAVGITHIVSLAGSGSLDFQVAGVEYLRVQCEDVPKEDIARHFSTTSKFIHRARGSGGTVLVHCFQGVSRASAVTLAYLLGATTLDLEMLLAALKAARPVADPNEGFWEQLRQCAEGQRRRALQAELAAVALEGGEIDAHLRNAADEAWLRALASGINPDRSLASVNGRTVLWVHAGSSYLVDQRTAEVFDLGGRPVGTRKNPEVPGAAATLVPR
jgi:atypical dual specificity phosphatase